MSIDLGFVMRLWILCVRAWVEVGTLGSPARIGWNVRKASRRSGVGGGAERAGLSLMYRGGRGKGER